MMADNKQSLKNLLKSMEIYTPEERFIEDMKGTQSLSSGSFLLDEAIGIGGFPKGKIVEFFGNDSSGKTTLALHTLAQVQKENKVAVYVDLENTINFAWAKTIGVDVKNLYIARPKSGEAVFELIKDLISLSKVDLVVVDSVANIVPSCELDNSIEDQQVGHHARLMSKGLRVIQSRMIGGHTTILFINQIREKMNSLPYMPSVTTTGGRALKYAAAVRVEIKRAERITDSSGNVLGFETKFIVSKNKYGAPMTTVKSAIYFDSGIDNDYEIISRLIDIKKIVKQGSWLSMDGKNIAQGINQLRLKMKSDGKLRNDLMNLAFPKLS